MSCHSRKSKLLHFIRLVLWVRLSWRQVNNSFVDKNCCAALMFWTGRTLVYYIIAWSYFIAFSFSQAMPDKVNATYGAKVSDLQIRPYPVGMKISALDTIRLRSSGERQEDYYCVNLFGQLWGWVHDPPQRAGEWSEAVFPSGPGWGSSGKADCERDSSCCRQVGNGLGPGLASCSRCPVVPTPFQLPLFSSNFNILITMLYIFKCFSFGVCNQKTSRI